MLRKILWTLGIIGVVMYIAKNPIGAAHAGKAIGAGAAVVAEGFGAFLGGLLG